MVAIRFVIGKRFPFIFEVKLAVRFIIESEKSGEIILIDCLNHHIFSFVNVHYSLLIILQVWHSSHNEPVTQRSKRKCCWSVRVHSQTLPTYLMFEKCVCLSVCAGMGHAATHAEPCGP